MKNVRKQVCGDTRLNAENRIWGGVERQLWFQVQTRVRFPTSEQIDDRVWREMRDHVYEQCS